VGGYICAAGAGAPLGWWLFGGSVLVPTHAYDYPSPDIHTGAGGYTCAHTNVYVYTRAGAYGYTHSHTKVYVYTCTDTQATYTDNYSQAANINTCACYPCFAFCTWLDRAKEWDLR
jgi:hypothetical protein